MGVRWRSLAALLSLLVASGSRDAHAGSDPARRWFTLATAHFAVHTYDGGERFAREVGAYAEEARAVVGELLGWYPPERTHIVVVDENDDANGFAGTLPAPLITLFDAAPPPDTELGDYANWLRLLVFHEYAHIAHLDQAYGIPAWVNRVFGRAWKPNNALPRWVTEGIAVWVESTRAGGGRVGSSLMEMYLRATMLEGTPPRLDELTGDRLEPPHGTAWYLYGGYLFATLARVAGDQSLKAFARVYATRPLPYALNALARQTTGKTFFDWYGLVLEEAKARALGVADRVRAEGLREGIPITPLVESLDAVRATPDGRQIVWVQSNGHGPTQIAVARAPVAEELQAGARVRAFEPTDPPVPIVDCKGGCSGLAVSRDGLRLVYSTGRYQRAVNFYGTLAEVRLAPGRDRREPRFVPGSWRARDATAAADDGVYWCTRGAWGESWLDAVDAASGALRRHIALPPDLAGAGAWPRFDRPVASADGRALFVSLHVRGNRDLWRVDLTTATPRFERLTLGAAQEIDPILSPDQRWLVYASDADGVYNVYARELATGATHKVTNVLTGAFEPAIVSDGRVLVYLRWTAGGYRLHALPFEPATAPEVSVTDGRPLRAVERPVVVAATRHPYQPLPTLIPRTWVPTLQIDSTGLSLVGLSFATFDATGRFGVAVGVDVTPETGHWSAWGELALHTNFPDLTFDVGRYTWLRNSYVGDVSEPYREEIVYGAVTLGLPRPDVFASLQWGLGYHVELARGYAVGRMEHTPEETTAFVPREGVDTSLNVFVGVDDTEGYAYSISPMRGFSLFANVALRHPALGSVGHAFALTFAGHAYVPMPWLDDHVIALRVGGGFSGGDPGERTWFSVGGVPRQDLLSDLLRETSAGSAWLRGFAPDAFQGTSFGLWTTEYRMPLVRIRRGLGTLPLAVGDLGLAAFADVGGATASNDLAGAMRVGVGGELRLRIDLFFGLVQDLRLGYAHGFGVGGTDHVYFLMAGAP